MVIIRWCYFTKLKEAKENYFSNYLCIAFACIYISCAQIYFIFGYETFYMLGRGPDN